jgi:hypothetical protein
MPTRYCSLAFPESLVQQPIFHELVKVKGLTANIHRARVTNDAGWLIVSFDNDTDTVDACLADLRGRGVSVVEGDSTLLELASPPHKVAAVKVHLEIPVAHVHEPVLAELIANNDVVVNIRWAEVTDDRGVIDLVISGGLDAIDAAIDSLRDRGVVVSPIEGNVIE